MAAIKHYVILSEMTGKVYILLDFIKYLSFQEVVKNSKAVNV